MRRLFATLLFILISVESAFAATVSLTWNPSSDVGTGVAGYYIYRNGARIGQSATTTYSDTTAVAGANYNYTVSAFDNAGNESSRSTPFTITISSSGGGRPPTTFVPVHKYYIAPTGCSDANAGTSPTAPWCTPNHPVVCGDVIVAAPGDYSSTNLDWGTVSSCPSTSGGIDGTGGIYFAVLLCGGADLEACHSTGRLWNIDKSNWSVQGFRVTNTGTGSANRAFNSDGCNTSVVHHHAFVNNIVASAASAFHTDDCGNTPSYRSVDYWAVVGNIAQNAAQNSDFCEAAIDAVAPGVLDSAAGTHIYIYNNYTWKNQAPGCVTQFDAEAIMFDAWDQRATNYQGVIANNIVWQTMRYCIHVFSNGSIPITPTMKIYNNTCYSNLTNIGSDWADGELNLDVGHPWSIFVHNNIAQATIANVSRYAMLNGGGFNSGVVNGGAGMENILKGAAPSCRSDCDAGNNEAVFDGNSLGTNIYTDPLFANVNDLIANRSGAPNCSGFINVTACMGWDATTETLTALSVIGDLTPTASATIGKGFQRPSTACVANADFPTWLKGIVYLRVSGPDILQYHDLATKPCGL